MGFLEFIEFLADAWQLIAGVFAFIMYQRLSKKRDKDLLDSRISNLELKLQQTINGAIIDVVYLKGQSETINTNLKDLEERFSSFVDISEKVVKKALPKPKATSILYKTLKNVKR